MAEIVPSCRFVLPNGELNRAELEPEFLARLDAETAHIRAMSTTRWLVMRMLDRTALILLEMADRVRNGP